VASSQQFPENHFFFSPSKKEIRQQFSVRELLAPEDILPRRYALLARSLLPAPKKNRTTCQPFAPSSAAA
jgi:hypothetical protein